MVTICLLVYLFFPKDPSCLSLFFPLKDLYGFLFVTQLKPVGHDQILAAFWRGLSKNLAWQQLQLHTKIVSEC